MATLAANKAVRMKKTRQVFLAGLLVMAAQSAAWSYWITAYYPTWSRMTPAQVPWAGLTHVIHFSGGGPVTTSPFFDHSDMESVAGQQAALLQNAHASGVKVLMSVGGAYGGAGGNLTAISQDLAKIDTFVATAANYAFSKGYDGIEVDWEPYWYDHPSQVNADYLLDQFRAKVNLLWGAPGVAAASSEWKLRDRSDWLIRPMGSY